MATHTVDTAAMREAGGGSIDYYTGRNGRVVAFDFTGVANGDIFNIGPGCQWVAWENTAASASHPVGPIFDGVDRVTFETSSTRDGRLWCFYKNGCGDARGSTGGTTKTPANVSEVSRDILKMRMVIFSVSSITGAQTSSFAVAGARHVLTRPNGSGTGQCDARFANEGQRNIGRVTWGVISGTKQCRAILLCGPGSPA